jgi:hypothetical protein
VQQDETMPFRPLVIFPSPATEAILRQNCLDSLDAIFERRAAAHVRHVGRAVWKTELHDEDGQRSTAFVKLSWGRRRWWPRLSDIRTGQVFKSLAVREWEGLAAFERLGLRVPERLALLEEGLLWKRSALILREVPPPASLSDMILDGSWLWLPLEDRQLILAEFARTLCRIHGSGWAWRSISTRHVFPQRTGQDGWEVWLIDCEGVHRTHSAETLHRDFRRFMRALAHDQADEQTLGTMRTIGSQLPTLAGSERGATRSKRAKSAA